MSHPLCCKTLISPLQASVLDNDSDSDSVTDSTDSTSNTFPDHDIDNIE